MIQAAIAWPAPPAAAMPAENPQQWNRLPVSSVTPISGSASGENGIGPFTQVRMPDSPVTGIRRPAASAIGSNRSWSGGDSSGPRSPGLARPRAGGPPGGAGAALPPADGQAAGLRLDVEPAVGIAEGGKVTGQAGDLVGDDVLVLDGTDGNVRAGQAGRLGPPHPGRVDDNVAL